MDAVMNFLVENIKLFRFRDILDIIIVTYIVYKGIKFVRETRAAQLVKGILILVVGAQLSGWFQLNSINYILVNSNS